MPPLSDSGSWSKCHLTATFGQKSVPKINHADAVELAVLTGWTKTSSCSQALNFNAIFPQRVTDLARR